MTPKLVCSASPKYFSSLCSPSPKNQLSQHIAFEAAHSLATRRNTPQNTTKQQTTWVAIAARPPSPCPCRTNMLAAQFTLPGLGILRRMASTIRWLLFRRVAHGWARPSGRNTAALTSTSRTRKELGGSETTAIAPTTSTWRLMLQARRRPLASLSNRAQLNILSAGDHGSRAWPRLRDCGGTASLTHWCESEGPCRLVSSRPLARAWCQAARPPRLK